MVIVLPRTTALTANQRPHWRKKAVLTRDLRTRGRLAWLNAGLAPMDRAHLVVTLAWHDARRRDANNWQPTVKGLAWNAAKTRCPNGHPYDRADGGARPRRRLGKVKERTPKPKATTKPETPKPKPASNLPEGWFKPSPKIEHETRPRMEEQINVVILGHTLPTPEQLHLARRHMEKRAPDLLEMLGLAS